MKANNYLQQIAKLLIKAHVNSKRHTTKLLIQVIRNSCLDLQL